jgi:hypothetical protein
MIPTAKNLRKKLMVYSPSVMNYLRARLFLGTFFHAIGLMRPGQLYLEAHAEILLLRMEGSMVFLIGQLLKATMMLNLGWKQ